MDMNLDLKAKKEAVEKELEHLLPSDESQLSEAMRYAVLSGGKRYRPLLALSSGEWFGVPQDTLLPFAGALELIHNYSLIHDDLPCMDDDDTRRGLPTCHKAFDENIAVLAGDGLLTLAFSIMAESALPNEREPARRLVLQEVGLRAGIEGMVGGQALDISLTSEKITKEKLDELIGKKTGALIVASVRLGALLGGAPVALLTAITDYGTNLGLAFQTRDDINDSIEDAGVDSQARPNTVSVYGLEGAKKRLERFVQSSLQALDKEGITSSSLRFLADKLLNVKDN